MGNTGSTGFIDFVNVGIFKANFTWVLECVCERVWRIHEFWSLLHILSILRLGYLVDVNVLAFNSPGPVPEGVM